MKNRGFTLIELLVVLMIIGLVASAALPTILTSFSERGPLAAVQMIQTELTAATSRAYIADIAGFRLIPDEQAWPIQRLKDGTIDPSQPLALTRIVSLFRPADYADGLINSATPYPSGFIAHDLPLNPITCNRIVIEESLVDSLNLRTNPTNWYWNLKLGDVVTIVGNRYTVCGPMIVGPGDGNAECYVNIGLPGKTVDPSLVLNRGQGMVEWLCLTNQIDDDHDGLIDDGWNGLDDDLDGFTDALPEWEVETLVGSSTNGFTASSYNVSRRLSPRLDKTSELPSNVVIDMSRWNLQPIRHDETSWYDMTGVLHTLPGIDYSHIRSRLPVNLYTGCVDLTFDRNGRMSPTSIYGMTTQTPFAQSTYEVWIGNREDVSNDTVPLVVNGVPVNNHDGTPMMVLQPPRKSASLLTIQKLNGASQATEAIYEH